jgi:hypothetical protein
VIDRVTVPLPSGLTRTSYERLERVEIEKRKPVETGSLEMEWGSRYRP